MLQAACKKCLERLDPVSKNLDLFRGQWITLGGHDVHVVGWKSDELDDPAFIGVGGDDGRAAGFSAGEDGGGGVEAKAAFLLFRSVAVVTSAREDFHDLVGH